MRDYKAIQEPNGLLGNLVAGSLNIRENSAGFCRISSRYSILPFFFFQVHIWVLNLADSVLCFVSTIPVDSDLFVG